MIRVVIADDHTIFRQGLAELLAAEQTVMVAGMASDGEEALALVRSLHPDILLLDISMPALDGFEVARKIKAQKLPVKVLMLSMHKETVSVRRAFELAVDGYVLKEEAFSDLLYAIEAISRGKRFFSPSVMSALSPAPARGGEDDPLTPREREVVVGIAMGKTAKEIASELGISGKTVETHRERIMQKLDCHRIADIVRYAMKQGYIS